MPGDSPIKTINFNTLNMYVEFEMIVDTDYGLIRYIADNFADERMFYIETLNEEENLLKGMLYERESYNPLVVPAIDESDIDKLDSFYNQFMQRYRKEIILDSVGTGIIPLLASLILSDSNTVVTVICANEMEESVLDALLPKSNKGRDWKVIYYDPDVDTEGLNVRGCDALCVKFSRNLFRYNGIDGKTIYIADLMCNIDQKILKDTGSKYPNLDATLYFENNDVKFIEMYPYDPSYSVNGTFDDTEEDEEQIRYNEDGSVHYDFEDEVGITNKDVELLKEWLNPEELANAVSTYKKESGPVREIEEIENPYASLTQFLYGGNDENNNN